MKSSLHSLIHFLPLFSVTSDCRLSQFSAPTANSGTQPSFNSSCVRSLLYSLGADPQKIPLPPVACWYTTAEMRCEPTENAACNTSSIVSWRHSVRDAFLCWVRTSHYLATALSLPPRSCFEQIRHNIKMDLREIRWAGMDWIHVA
jgi:hypothetical protein